MLKSTSRNPLFTREMLIKGATTYAYISLWITLSALVIMFNKYILAFTTMEYPVMLTLCHMAFSTVVTTVLVKGGVVQPVEMSWENYTTSIIPIAGLFAIVLWLGNAAYEYLSVSFIQMLKALMPVCVYSLAMGFGLETFSWKVMSLMSIITVGVSISSHGELLWDTVGVMFQLASIVFEAIRLNLVQILIQRKGLKLNPVLTLYYLAPVSFAFLSLPFIFLELPLIRNDARLVFDAKLILLNCSAAFCLNLSVFLLIGRTSALTMNVAGVVKDWILIGLSALIFKNPVTKLNLIGYSISFLAVAVYNQLKIRQLAQQMTQVKLPQGQGAGAQPSQSPARSSPAANTALTVAGKREPQGLAARTSTSGALGLNGSGGAGQGGGPNEA